MTELQKLRAFASGEINESAFSEIQDSNEPFTLEDEELITECTDIAARMYIQTELLGESADEIDQAVNETYSRLQNYLIGQGMINEATLTVKKNQSAMIISKEGQINRLKKIFTLKFARRANNKDYKKFKIGANLKKISMERMLKLFGKKAEALARKTWKKVASNPKVNAVIADKKKKK